MTSLGDMFPSHTGMMPVPPALFVPVGKKGPDTKMYPCPISYSFLSADSPTPGGQTK